MDLGSTIGVRAERLEVESDAGPAFADKDSGSEAETLGSDADGEDLSMLSGLPFDAFMRCSSCEADLFKRRCSVAASLWRLRGAAPERVQADSGAEARSFSPSGLIQEKASEGDSIEPGHLLIPNFLQSLFMVDSPMPSSAHASRWETLKKGTRSSNSTTRASFPD
mmetsp:Transcript_36051/g.74131  ORF Transcript_36051/g.74131 Transcript_36051/m.74131 type:complete len:166 (-) Transcript_36051:536-1033(-)